MKKLIGLLVAFFCLANIASAQAKGTGGYAFASFDNRGFDSVNIGNLNVRFTIPIVNKPGRGMGFNYALQYEGLIWSVDPSTSTWTHDPSWGLTGVLNGTSFTGYLTYIDDRQTCPGPSGNHGGYDDILTNVVYHDAFGGVHSFDYSVDEQDCPDDGAPSGAVISGSGGSYDGSGYTLLDLGTIQSRNGTIIHPHFSATDTSSASIVDTNGNQISANGSGGFTDTLGTTPLTVSGSSPVTFTYPVTRQADGSTTKNAVLSYQTYNIQTNFGCGAGEYNQSGVSLPDRFTYPDGSYYQFTYEPTYGSTSGSVTGRLASVTLPTGGTISYSYIDGCSGAGMNPDGTVGALVRTTSDGSRTYGRYPINGNSTGTILYDEKSNQTQYAFTIDAGTGHFFETHRQVYQGTTSGPQLLDQYTCYNGAGAPCDGASVSLPISEADVLASYNNGSQALTKNTYDPNGTLLTGSSVYGGSTLITSTSNSYNALGELTATGKWDGNGTAYEFSYYGYDEQSPIGTSGLPQHVGATGTRGNLTSAHTSAGATYINTSTTYYDTGMPASTTAADGGVTTYSYDSTQGFATVTRLPVPSSGAAMSTGASYDVTSAALLSSNGMSSDTTSVNQYDVMMRPVSVSLPSGSVVSSQIFSPIHFMVHQTLDSSRSSTKETLLDSYGRVSRVGIGNGQAVNGWYQVDYCYDASGLLAFQSSVYQSTGELDGNGNNTPKHCSGSGKSYQYDALGRVVTLTTDDGSSTTQYQNRAVKKTDVNGVQRITQYDLLGRVSSVCEVSGNALAGQSPVPCGADIAAAGFLTTYSYDLVNHITTINQGGQIRTFQTDPAGRTIATSEPERGSTTYTYSYNSVGLQLTRTRPAANQTNPSNLTTTTTQYDQLARVVSISYNDGITPNKNYYYDTQPPGWQASPSNLLGRLVETSGGANTSSLYSYDVAGNVTTMWQCAPSTCSVTPQGRPALSFTYDLAGALMSYTDGASGTIAYGRSPVEEITSVNNLSYTDAPNTPNLVSNVTNGPFGPTSWQLGNNTSAVQSFDSMGRNNGGWLCTGTGGLGSTSYCSGNTQLYGYTTAYIGNRTNGMCDVAVNQCQSHGYDEFNRLTAVSGGPASFTFSYDRWGNRTQQTGSPSVSFNFDGANRNTSFSYDAAGNQITDGIHSYTYDAEGKILLVDGGGTAQYTYDAMDNRVRIQMGSGVTEFMYDPFGRRTSTWLVGSSYGAGGFGNEGRIYWDGGLLANRSWNGTTYFHHKDWLGTERVRTDYQGNVANAQVSRAFGDGFTQSSSDVTGAGQDNNQFTSQERDSETNTTHFQYRQYSPTQGRWMSPDPYAGSYDIGNPQSLNRYSYVLNNPYSLIDPSGLTASSDCDPSEVDGDGCDPEGQAAPPPVVPGQTVNVVTDPLPPPGTIDVSVYFQYYTLTNYWANYYTNSVASGSVGGPNNGLPSAAQAKKESDCEWESLKKNGAAIGLDLAGFIPGEKLVGAGFQLVSQVAIGGAAIVNSAWHNDTSGAFRSLGGIDVNIVTASLKEGAVDVGKALPGLGTLLNVYSTGADILQARKDFNACMARP